MQVILIDNVRLQIESAGRVVPWIGPALRGLVAGRLKAMACLHPPHQRATKWEYCDGCPHINRCAYGKLFEPAEPVSTPVQMPNGGGSAGDGPGTAPLRQLMMAARGTMAEQNRVDVKARGWDASISSPASGSGNQARPLARRIVLAPYYPLPERIGPGFAIPVNVILVGAVDAQTIEALYRALADAGRKPGLGPDGVTYRVDSHVDGLAAITTVSELRPAEFPGSPDAVPGVIPRLGIGLTSPLFLYPRDKQGKRQVNTRPEFVDYFRASQRIVRRLFEDHGETLDADWKALDAAAQRVEIIDECYQRFSQSQWSTRRYAHRPLRGVTGGALFRDVPWSLLPWIMWGGRLHSGTDRVAGAGGWRVVLE